MTEQAEIRQEQPAAQTAAESDQVGGVPAQAPFKVFATKEEYQQHFDRILGQRLKSARKKSEKVDRTEESTLPQGTPSGQAAGIAAALEEEVAKLIDADSSLYEGADAEALAADQKFLTLLSHGFSVKEAYDALHLTELGKRMAEQANKQAVSNILARGMRPQEGVASGLTAGAFAVNVAAMNGEEIDAVLDRARRGESISF